MLERKPKQLSKSSAPLVLLDSVDAEPAELWELIERTVDPDGELNPEEPREKRELGQRVNEWVRRKMADGVGRPDLAQVEE